MFTITPSSSSVPLIRSSAPLTPLVCDERVIQRLLGEIINKGGLTPNEVARRMGVSSNAIRQYLRGRRNRPSLIWFVRLAELCGARVLIEFPGKR
jgi:hypothetical protein